jgi:UDP-N-acetylglucosamine 2-epimerase
MSKIKVGIFVCTRPEAIKMAPVVKALRENNDFHPTLISTGQHKEMLNQVFSDFKVFPDYEMNLMLENQTLCSLSGRLFSSIEKIVDEGEFDWILVQGDTTTAMVASVCAFL